MTHVTCRLTVKNRDQLRNPTPEFSTLATRLPSHPYYTAHIESIFPFAAVRVTPSFHGYADKISNDNATPPQIELRRYGRWAMRAAVQAWRVQTFDPPDICPCTPELSK